MNVHETRIEWATHTWNPVTGCRHNCDYCYARRGVGRFKPKATERPANPDTIKEEPEAAGCYRLNGTTRLIDAGGHERVCQYPVGFAPALYEYKLDQPERRLIPSRIFVSSMGDLFGSWVPDVWIEEVFAACKRAPQHTYLFLTKNPGRYAELYEDGKLPLEKNFWYGASATSGMMMDNAAGNFGHVAEKVNTFLSMEPLIQEIVRNPSWSEFCFEQFFDWLIIGGMTGPGSKHRQPRREWVEKIVEAARVAKVPVFMKGNLAPAWGDDLIMEHPAGMLWPEEETT